MATVAPSTRFTLVTLGSLSAGPFNLTFRLFDTDSVKVYINKVPTLAFTLNAAFVDGYSDTATITLNTAQIATTEILIDSALTARRDEDYTNGDQVVENLNIEQARIWSKLQELQRDIQRCARGLTAINPTADDLSDLAALGVNVTAAAASATAADASADAAALSAAEALAKENSMLRARGAWVTALLYSPSDIVTFAGSSYVCLISHIAGVFATDLSASRWTIFAEKGASGAGVGDMLNSDNLSGLTTKPLAYTTIGGKAVGKVDLLPFSLVDPAMVITHLETIEANKLVETAFPHSRAVAEHVDAMIRATNINLQSFVAATGTAVTLSGIPSWAKRVTVYFDNVRRNGTSNLELRLGDAGGIENTGYVSASYYYNIGTIQGTPTGISSGFTLSHNIAATSVFDGTVTLQKGPSNKWSISSGLGFSVSATSPITTSGFKTLSDVLTDLQITTNGGVNLFNQGSMAVSWE